MSIEIANAYVALTTKMPGVKKEIAGALGSSDVQNTVSNSGKSMGDKILSGIGKIAKVGAVAVGGLIAGGIGTALVKGFQRLNSLDQATAKLTGLGHSAETVDTIMQNALASVSGTAFGMGDAATVAANAVAAGIKPGEDLERTLKAVADASTIAGTDMGAMGAIFGKVAASNKAQMDVINQLHDAGVPALALLAEQMGVTAEEAAKMASDGKVDFETFQAAMEAGMGGAAQESGSTFSGAMDNVMASLGRVGEGLLGGLFPQMTDGFKGIITWLKPFEVGAKEIGQTIGDFVADAGPKLVDVLQRVWEAGQNVVKWVQDNLTWLGPLVVAIAAGTVVYAAWTTAISIWQGVVKAATAVQAAFNAVMNANPIMLVIIAITALVAGLIWFFTQTELGREIWANFTQFLSEAWTNIVNFGTALWEGLAKFFTDTWNNIVKGVQVAIGLVRAVIIAVGTAISTWWNNLWSGVGKFISDTWNKITTTVRVAITLVRTVISNIGTAISTWWNNLWKGVASFFQGIWDGIVDVVRKVGDAFGSVFRGIRDAIKNAFSGIVNIVKAPINAIISLVNSAIRALNGLSVKIPDWVPGVGGSTFGVNLPTIPMLANGAVVQGSTAGTLAMIGEAGRGHDEAILPLPADWRENGFGRGGDEYHFHGQFALTPAEIGRVLDQNRRAALYGAGAFRKVG